MQIRGHSAAVLRTIVAAAALSVTYCLVEVYVGHGQASAALVLVAGRALPYLAIAVLGWLGVCALVLAVWLAGRRAGSAVLVSSVGLLLASWLGLLWVTANRELTLWSSIPFLVVAAWVLLSGVRMKQKPSHGRLAFVMPAPSAAAFEAFFNHEVRLRWDTLLRVNYIEGGGTHPYAGAISINRGRGWKGGVTMRTRFLVYDPPRQAAAEMVEPTGVFERWAASMRFADRGDGSCNLIYTYALQLRPVWLEALFGWAGNRLFARETRRRFNAMAAYLRARK